jgi:hypothetical protein
MKKHKDEHEVSYWKGCGYRNGSEDIGRFVMPLRCPREYQDDYRKGWERGREQFTKNWPDSRLDNFKTVEFKIIGTADHVQNRFDPRDLARSYHPQ